MATVATPNAVSSRDVKARPVRGGAGRTFDTLMWQFMRISGAALIPLALGHLAIMHLMNNVNVMNTCFVAIRWANLTWRIYDAALLGFAMIHGLNGVRYSVDDYIHNPTLNSVLRWAIVVVGLVVFLAGAIALVGGVRMTPLPTSLANCTP